MMFAFLQHANEKAKRSIVSMSYIITLDFVDRNSTKKNQRLFTVNVNGLTTQPIDIFAAAGTLKPYTMRIPALVTNGTLTLLFKASTNNAVVSGIEIRQAQ